MRKGIYWVVRIIALALAIKLGLWIYQSDLIGGRERQKTEVSEIDKLCKKDADTGRCVCRHRRTNERLEIPYEECVSRSRMP